LRSEQVKAFFSPSYLSLILEFTDHIQYVSSCTDIFLPSTLVKLGSGPSCRWNRDRTQVEAKFGKLPTLGNEIVFLKSLQLTSGECSHYPSALEVLAEFQYPLISPEPNLEYVAQYALSCATRQLLLNAMYSKGSAGRPLQYFWHFDTFVPVGPIPDPTFFQAYESSEFEDQGFKFVRPGWSATYYIVLELSVRNWLQEEAFLQALSTQVFFGEKHSTVQEDGPNVVTMKRSETRDFRLDLQFQCTFQSFLLLWQYVYSPTGAPMPDINAILTGSPSSDVLRIPRNVLLPNNSYIFRSFGIEGFTFGIDFLTINVLSTPLEISVNRASGVVSASSDLFISAADSSDPDEMPGLLSFAWDCTDVNGSNCTGSDGLPLFLASNSSSFTIPASRLVLGSVLNIDLTIAKDSRQSSYSLRLEVNSTAAVSVYTHGPIKKLNPQVTQQVSILVDSAATLHWTQTEGPAVQSSSGYDFPILAFLPYYLTENQRYSFEATVSDGVDFVTVQLQFAVNMGPTGGRLLTLPSSGRANETVIDLLAVDWIDADEEDYPLTYEFGSMQGRVFNPIASAQYEMLLRTKPELPGRIMFGLKTCDALNTCTLVESAVTLGESMGIGGFDSGGVVISPS
jgi:hypothetical protein